MGDKRDSVETKKQIEELKEWANKQTDFPKDIEDRMYLRFLHSCYYDIEKAKNALEVFITFRNDSPELLCNRDPLSPDIQKMLKVLNLSQYKISGDRNLWLWQLNDPGLEVYDYVLEAKIFILSGDTFLLQNDFLEESDIIIIDVKNFSLKILTKFNVSVAKKLMKYQEEGLPARIQQIHIVNCPSFIGVIYGLIKPFIKKSSSLINFHSPNSDTLYKFLSKDELPADYGGSLPKLDDLMKSELAKIMSCRDRLVDVNLWRVDKKQAKEKPEFSNKSRTLRTLAID